MTKLVRSRVRCVEPSELCHVGERKAGQPSTCVILDGLKGPPVLRLTCQPESRAGTDKRRESFSPRFIDVYFTIEHAR